MSDSRHEMEDYIEHIAFPVTKEELINGLLLGDAPGRLIALAERLPQARYEHRSNLRQDLTAIDHLHATEIAGAHTYDQLLAVVLHHVGDIRHTTKDSYNRLVDRVIHIAERQGTLSADEARGIALRLIGAFADLRGTMDEVYDDKAPVNPRDDLPRLRG